MEDEVPPSPTARGPFVVAPSQHRETQNQGVQLLPLLKKYFQTAGLLLLVWIIGYFGFSSVWVIVGLFFHVTNEEYRKIKDAKIAYAKEAVRNEKEAILARVDELPAWVYFPDVERAEWLNKALKQMWPYIGGYVQELLVSTVEPSIQQSLPNSLRPFKFEKIDLGDVPPRVGGVKVYTENVRRDEIIMDMEIFYASDSQISVAVRGINAGIKDLTIHGTIRVVMKPLVKVMPIIGGINVFFLNQPTVDFDLTKTANLLDLPLLSNSLRTIVEDQIAYYMVLPNKIPVKLAQNLDLTALKYPTPAGVIRLHIVAAREMKKADVNVFGKGKSDPYVKVYVGAQTFKTKVISDTVNPVWNQYYEAVVDQQHGQFVELECLDQDPGDDDELGTASIDLATVVKSGSMDSWLPLENISTGMIHVRALWLHLSNDPEDLEKEERLRKARISTDFNIGAAKRNSKETMTTGSEDTLSTALLMINVDSAKNLPRGKKSLGEPSPYAKVTIGNDTRKTVPVAKTDNPTWEDNFQFLIHNVHMQDLQIEVLDSAKNNKKLGNMTFSLKNLLTAKDLTVNRPFQLRDSTPNAKISLRLCLRVLSSELPASWYDDTEEPVPMATVEETHPVSQLETPEEVPKMDSNDNMERSVPTAILPQPGVEEIISSPVIADKPGQELRYRGNPTLSSSSGDSMFGRLQLTLRHSGQRNKLIIVIHKCENLIPCDDDHLADPYVRIYLLPEKSSSSKRKTQTVKNNLNPIYDETFDWALTVTEASATSLDILVKNSIGIFSKDRSKMGRVVLDLSQIDLTRAHTEWYDLQDPELGDKSSD